MCGFEPLFHYPRGQKNYQLRSRCEAELLNEHLLCELCFFDSPLSSAQCKSKQIKVFREQSKTCEIFRLSRWLVIVNETSKRMPIVPIAPSNHEVWLLLCETYKKTFFHQICIHISDNQNLKWSTSHFEIQFHYCLVVYANLREDPGIPYVLLINFKYFHSSKMLHVTFFVDTYYTAHIDFSTVFRGYNLISPNV